MSYYDVLEVSPKASVEVIKGAYRYLVQKWHPDRNLSDADEATARLKMINEAYAVLSNPDRRKAYDDSLRQRAPEESERNASNRGSYAKGTPSNGGSTKAAPEWVRSYSEPLPWHLRR